MFRCGKCIGCTDYLFINNIPRIFCSVCWCILLKVCKTLQGRTPIFCSHVVKEYGVYMLLEASQIAYEYLLSMVRNETTAYIVWRVHPM
jgi:hypothetical protein